MNGALSPLPPSMLSTTCPCRYADEYKPPFECLYILAMTQIFIKKKYISRLTWDGCFPLTSRKVAIIYNETPKTCPIPPCSAHAPSTSYSPDIHQLGSTQNFASLGPNFHSFSFKFSVWLEMILSHKSPVGSDTMKRLNRAPSLLTHSRLQREVERWADEKKR